MIRRPPRSTLDRSSAASDVYKRQFLTLRDFTPAEIKFLLKLSADLKSAKYTGTEQQLSLIHISEPTRPY